MREQQRRIQNCGIDSGRKDAVNTRCLLTKKYGAVCTAAPESLMRKDRMEVRR